MTAPTLALLAIGLTSQSGLTSAEFKPYHSVAGGFTINLPEAPKEERKTVQTPQGPREFLMASLNSDGVYYQIIRLPTTAVPANGMDEFQDGVRQSVLKTTQGKIENEREVQSGNLAGREFVFQGAIPALKGRGHGVTRSFLGQSGYAYSIQVAMDSGQYLTGGGEKFARDVLDSFHVDDAPAAGEAPLALEGHATAVWQSYSSKEGRFAITFPAPPVERTQRDGLPEGTTQVVTAAANAEGMTCVVVAMTLSRAVPASKYAEFFEGNTAGLLDETRGKLLSERDAPAGAFPGRRIAYQAPLPDGSGPGTSHARVVLAGNRVYTITATAPKGKLSLKEAGKFLDSFEVGTTSRRATKPPRPAPGKAAAPVEPGRTRGWRRAPISG